MSLAEEWNEFEGGVYVGQTKDKLRHGYGEFRLHNGDFYKGDWKKDKRHGYGEMHYKSGAGYKGGYKNNTRHGIGLVYHVDGRREVLLYRDGRFVKSENLQTKGMKGMRSVRRGRGRHGRGRWRKRVPLRELDLSGESPENHWCPNVRLCWDFISRKLKLKTKYFRFEWNICWCSDCLKERGEEKRLSGKRGGTIYAYPHTWTKFGIPVPSLYVSDGALDDWHVSFHGTRPDSARIIIEESKGVLLIPGDVTPSGFRIPVENPIDRDKNWEQQIFLSPSIKYCEKVYCPATEHDGHSYRVAFQVRIKPGTYKVGPETKGFTEKNEVVDPLVPNSGLEWFTNRRNVCVVTGILIRREDIVRKISEEEEEEGEEKEED